MDKTKIMKLLDGEPYQDELDAIANRKTNKNQQSSSGMETKKEKKKMARRF